MKYFFKLLTLSLLCNSFAFSANNQFIQEFSYLQNYEYAKKRSIKEKKPLMVMFVTKVCPWCKKLENQTLSKEYINAYVHQNFIPLMLDKDSDKYPSFLKPKVVPTIYFVKPKENRFFDSIIGYKHRKEFFDLLRDAVRKSGE